jgi:anti-sigma B factor antagonist
MPSSNGSLSMGQLTPTPFEAAVERRGPAVVVVLSGELDLAAEERFREALASERDGWSELVIDLSELEFIDSCGVRLILEQEHGAKAAGRRFRVLLGEGPARRVFHLLGLDGGVSRGTSSDEVA